VRFGASCVMGLTEALNSNQNLIAAVTWKS